MCAPPPPDNHPFPDISHAGCINDVHNLKQFCVERFKFEAANIVVLTDDSKDPNLMPTRANITKYFK